MPIIRLSVLGDEAFAPDREGNMATTRDGKHASSLGRFPMSPREEKGSRLHEYLQREASTNARKLMRGPVVVMVHGFWYDPADPIRPDRPHRSDNPHDLNYHFSRLR